MECLSGLGIIWHTDPYSSAYSCTCVTWYQMQTTVCIVQLLPHWYSVLLMLPISPTSKYDTYFSSSETSVLCLVCSLLYNILENASRQKAGDFRTHLFCLHGDHHLVLPVVHYLKSSVVYFSQFSFIPSNICV